MFALKQTMSPTSMSRSLRGTVALVGVGAAVLTACSSSKTAASSGNHSTVTAGGTKVAISSSAGTLVGPNGHTLYENTVDTATSIKCTGACAEEWPPLTGDPTVSGPLNASDFATVARPDGTMQVTFQGHPLYYFDEDKTAGSAKGAGLADQGGSWHPAAASVLSTTGGTSSAAPTTTDSGGYGGGGY